MGRVKARKAKFMIGGGTKVVVYGPFSAVVSGATVGLNKIGLRRSIAKASRAKSGSLKVKELNGRTTRHYFLLVLPSA